MSTLLTESLVDYFAEQFPAAKAIRYGPEFEPDGQTYKVTLVAPGDEGSPFRASRYTNRLIADTGNFAVVHEEPVYRLWSSGARGADDDAEQTLDSLSGAQLAFDGSGTAQTDYLRVAVFPADGYRTGYDPAKIGARQPTNGYLVEGCEPYEITDAHAGTGDDRRFSFDCTESDGPNGERIVAVAAHEAYLAGDVTFTVNTVVVYRADRTAVVVSDTPRPALDWRQGSGTVPSSPALSLDDLTGLALAVPPVTFS